MDTPVASQKLKWTVIVLYFVILLLYTIISYFEYDYFIGSIVNPGDDAATVTAKTASGILSAKRAKWLFLLVTIVNIILIAAVNYKLRYAACSMTARVVLGFLTVVPVFITMVLGIVKYVSNSLTLSEKCAQYLMFMMLSASLVINTGAIAYACYGCNSPAAEPLVKSLDGAGINSTNVLSEFSRSVPMVGDF